MTTEFSSEGFDLDATKDDGGDEVVYEIGGGATVLKKETPVKEETPKQQQDEMSKAEEWKQKGNDAFKTGNFLEAFDLYTEAIEAVPDQTLTGEAILQQRDEFLEKERAKVIERQRQEMKEEEERRKQQSKNDNNNDDKEASKPKDNDGNKPPEEKKKPLLAFELPPQKHGEKLAIYYCNRAAASTNMERYDDAIRDCDVAVLLNPKYTKAYVRRSGAYEKSDRTEEALRDAKLAFTLEPSNGAIRKSVARLEKLEKERLDKLKEETLGKLKDLGNSILGNFGLSLDNFQAVQDPNTGSYSISFNQGK